MIIKAQYFEPCKGTVFVVGITNNNTCQGVFKTFTAAKKLAERIFKSQGVIADIRVGHFNDAGDIETI